MNKTSLFLILINSLLFLSCFQNDGQNQEETPDEKLTKTEFLSQANLLKYRDETKTIDFPYQDFGFHDSLKFNKVIAYDFDGTSLRVDENDRDESSVFLNDSGYSRRVKKQHLLNYQEIEQLLSIFTSEKYFGGFSALCFDPKLGFIFYQNDEVVNVIDICLDCNDFHLRRDFSPHKTYYPGMDIEKFESVESFNKKAVIGIKNLCEQLDFDYANFDMTERIYEDVN